MQRSVVEEPRPSRQAGRCWSSAAYLSFERGQVVGQGDQVDVGAGGRASSDEQRVHLGDRAADVPRDVADQRRLVGARCGGQVEAGGERGTGRVGAGRGRRGRGRRPCGRAGPRLCAVSMAFTVTGSGSVTSGPSRRTRHSSRATTVAPSDPESGEDPLAAARVRRLDAVVADEVRDARGRTRRARSCWPSSRMATAALSARSTWSLVSSSAAPSSVDPVARAGDQVAVVTGEAADRGGVLGADVDPHLQPGEQRVRALGSAVATWGDGPALRVEPQRLDRRPARARRRPGRRPRARRAAAGWCCGRAGTVEVTITVVDGVELDVVERVGAADHARRRLPGRRAPGRPLGRP